MTDQSLLSYCTLFITCVFPNAQVYWVGFSGHQYWWYAH